MKKQIVDDTEFIGYRNSAINQYVVSNQSDGFKPTTFVSSRSNRATAYNSSIKDYMDESDGILGGKLVVTKGIDSFKNDISRRSEGGGIDQSNNVIDYSKYFGGIPSSDSGIGKKLLSKMGWKEGQGIGPRLSSKRRSYLKSNQVDKQSEQPAFELLLHPAIDLGLLPASSIMLDDKDQRIITFAAAQDISQISIPQTKVDMFGIGFINTDRINDSEYEEEYDDLEHRVYRTEYVKPSSTNKNLNHQRQKSNFKTNEKLLGANTRGVKSKFGSGFSYDDESDDIYNNESTHQLPTNYNVYNHEVVQDIDEDDQQQYDRSIDNKQILSKINNSVEDWVSNNKSDSDNNFDTQNSLNLTCRIKGFHLSRTAKVSPPFYALPEVPSDFSTYHIFSKETIDDASTKVLSKNNLTSIEAARERTNLINTTQETSHNKSLGTQSIFDLLKPADKEKLNLIAKRGNPNPNSNLESIQKDNSLKEIQTINHSQQQSQQSTQRPMLTSSSVLNSTFAGLSQAFKNRFTSSSSDNKDNDQSALKEGITSSTEFAAVQKQKTNNTDLKNNTGTLSVKISSDQILPKQKLIRVTSSWVPVPLLCKRFNVKAPDINLFVEHTKQHLLQETSLLGLGLDRITTNSDHSSSIKMIELSELKKDKTREIAEKDILDVYLQPSLARTNEKALSEFKSIFEDSDSEEEEEEEKEEEKKDNYEKGCEESYDKQINEDINIPSNQSGNILNNNPKSTNSSSSSSNKNENNINNKLNSTQEDDFNVVKYVSIHERSNKCSQLSKTTSMNRSLTNYTFGNKNKKTKIEITDDGDDDDDKVSNIRISSSIVTKNLITISNDNNNNHNIRETHQKDTMKKAKRKFILSFSQDET